MAIAGVDVGTTGCKCTVYSNDGTLIDESYAEYVVNSVSGRELDPLMVWEKVKMVITKAINGNMDVQALCVTSFGEAAVLLDENNIPTTQTILYTDLRGTEQCSELEKKVGQSYIANTTGLNPHSNYSASKLMWIRQNKPDVWGNTKHIFLYSDYIVHMLCGSNFIDYSLATRTMLFNLKKLDWDDQLLNASGIEREKLPLPVATGTCAGYIFPSLAQELRVSPKMNIIIGCHDQIAAAVGTAVFDEGTATDGAGTVECVTPVYRNHADQFRLLEGNYATVPYIEPGSFVTYAYSFTGGALLKWYRDNLAIEQRNVAEKLGMNPYDYFNQSLKDSPSSLLVLPYFAGAATPYMDTSATGAILGLTLETKASDIYQALMEAVAFEMRVNIELLQKAGIQIHELHASGGGALSPEWLQMKADILNIPIVSYGAAQAGTLGCVMMAGVSSGIYPTLKAAADVFIHPLGKYLPRSSKHTDYEPIYLKYKKLYSLIKEI